ncbi:MAG TPA: DUF2269 family protein [Coxiellaceae bacterium]|nr:DUF2269 family protein [Coxiellaceae bacterium]
MAPFIQFIHVLCGVSFFGITIASFAYISKSIKKNDSALLHYALKTSLLGDRIIFPIIIIQFITGAMMVQYHHLSFQTPWIIVAFIALSVVSLIWFLLFLIKYINYSSGRNTFFKFKKSFFILNIIIILLFCMIIHDAIAQKTFLWR